MPCVRSCRGPRRARRRPPRSRHPSRACGRHPSAARRGSARTLRSPAPTPIATGTPPELAGIEGEDPLAQRLADEPSLEVERRDRGSRRPRRRVSRSPRDVGPERRDAPRAATDAEQRDIEPVPQVEDRANAGVRFERPLRAGVIEQPGGHQPVRLGAEGVGDRAGTGRAPARSTSTRRRAARPWRGPGSAAVVERVGDRRDRGAIADPDDRAVADGASRRTCAASRPTIRRVSSSGPARVGARWTASSPNRPRSDVGGR